MFPGQGFVINASLVLARDQPVFEPRDGLIYAAFLGHRLA